MNVPCSSTPAGPLHSATAAHWCCLPLFGRRRLPRFPHFGAQSHGPRTRCLRFAEWVAPPPRKTHFRIAGQPFRARLITHWVLMKVSGFIPSSSPRLRLAHPNSAENCAPVNSESDTGFALRVRAQRISDSVSSRNVLTDGRRSPRMHLSIDRETGSFSSQEFRRTER
jgi:hypothetical protein